MKARIWKHRETGWWHWEVRDSKGRVPWSGYRRTWPAVLRAVLPELYPGGVP